MAPSTTSASTEQVIPASVSHFIIFNPSLELSKKPKAQDAATAPVGKDGGQAEGEGEERDRDLEDDMKEAAQILFYTSREGGKVSRDRMLRQFGLAKGLMGFTDMVLDRPDESKDGGREKEKQGWWGVHSHKSRMIIWTPERGYFIYINVTLSHKKGGEAIHGSQGISDHMIVAALQRGYEDFCLLHGPLASLNPAANTTSSLLERFWTRFAFHFESIFLSPSNPGDILPAWIGGFPPASSPRSSTNTSIDELVDSSSSISAAGLMTRNGPLHVTSPIPSSLTRYFVSALPSPPPVLHVTSPTTADRSSLGLGFGLGLRRHPNPTSANAKAGEEDRQTSWTSWVPGLGAGSGSSTPTTRRKPEVSDPKTSRWPSFGLSSLGVGTVFGMGKEAEGAETGPTGAEDPKQNRETSSIRSQTASIGSKSSHHVEQSEVVMPDLAAAVNPDAEIELAWDKKDVWLGTGDDEKYEKRRVSWIIRDDTLLFVLFSPGTTAPYPLPSTAATLAIFASLAPTPLPPRGSSDSARPSTPLQSPAGNAFIYAHPNGTTETHEILALDPSSATTLSESKNRLDSDKSVLEIYAKSATGKVTIAKRLGDGDLYLQVGRKDASLTDAEQAVKSFRPHSAVVT